MDFDMIPGSRHPLSGAWHLPDTRGNRIKGSKISGNEGNQAEPNGTTALLGFCLWITGLVCQLGVGASAPT